MNIRADLARSLARLAARTYAHPQDADTDTDTDADTDTDTWFFFAMTVPVHGQKWS